MTIKQTDLNRARFVSHLSSLIADSCIIFLLWLFALAIFLPLGSLLNTTVSLSPLLGLIFIGLIGYFLVKSLQHGKIAVDSYVEMFFAGAGQGENDSRRIVMTSIGNVGLVVFCGIVTIPLLWWINPVLGGMGLVVAVLAIALLGAPVMGKFAERLIEAAGQKQSG